MPMAVVYNKSPESGPRPPPRLLESGKPESWKPKAWAPLPRLAAVGARATDAPTAIAGAAVEAAEAGATEDGAAGTAAETAIAGVRDATLPRSLESRRQLLEPLKPSPEPRKPRPRSPVYEWESEWKSAPEPKAAPMRPPPPPLVLPPPPPVLPVPPVPPGIISQCMELFDLKSEKFRRYNDASFLSICCIPESLRDFREIAYEPQIISLSPYHGGLSCFEGMEYNKMRALNRALARTGPNLTGYIKTAYHLYNDARTWNIGSLSRSLSLEDFVVFLVLNAIFILELFRCVAGENLGYASNDPVFAKSGTMHSLLRRDMILLRNQFPLFVLDKILALQRRYNPSISDNAAALALRFFSPLMPTENPPAAFDRLADSSDALHCLDLFRRSLLGVGPQSDSEWPYADKRSLIYCVTELRDAGIKFRPLIIDRFWDIRFEDGVLLIPRLIIDADTLLILLNLVDFERHYLSCDKHITSYVIFMKKLINTELDVEYLRRSEIIVHYGNDREVADWFRWLCWDVVFDIKDGYLSKLSAQVNDYYNHKLNAWKLASLIHEYFSNLWTIIC